MCLLGICFRDEEPFRPEGSGHTNEILGDNNKNTPNSSAFTHPLNSKKRQMTLATTSSFFSSGGGVWPILTLVRWASFSETVAPRQSAKSIVDDCYEMKSQIRSR